MDATSARAAAPDGRGLRRTGGAAPAGHVAAGGRGAGVGLEREAGGCGRRLRRCKGRAVRRRRQRGSGAPRLPLHVAATCAAGCKIACTQHARARALTPLRGLPRLTDVGPHRNLSQKPRRVRGICTGWHEAGAPPRPDHPHPGPLPWSLAWPRLRPRAPRAHELAAPMSCLRARLRLRGMAPVRNVRSRCGGSFHHARPSGQAGGAR